MFASSNILQVLWGQSYVFLGCCSVPVCAGSCPTLWDSMDCSPPGSSVNGLSQARILEWLAISFLQGSFPTQGADLHPLHCRQALTTEPRRKSPCLSSYCFLSLLAWILAFPGLWIFFFLWFVDLLHQSTSLSLFRSYFSLLLFVKLTFKLDHFG